MSFVDLFQCEPQTVVVYGTGVRYTWTTGWMLCSDLAVADVVFNVRNVDGNWQAKPTYQTAAVSPEYPDSPQVFTSGSYANAGNSGFLMFRETLGLSGKMWIRFGIAASNSSGANLGSANVGMQVARSLSVAEAGRGRFVMNPGMFGSTDTNVLELGPFAPTVGLSKVMAAFGVMNNVSTYFEYVLMCRTANDPRAANAWVDCESGVWTNPAAGNSLRNTGALSAPAGANVSTNLLIQWGLGFRKKSGAAGNPSCEVTVLVARSQS